MSPWSNGRVSFIVGVSRDCDWKMVPCAQEQLWSKRIKMQSCINPAACKAVAAPCSQFGKPIYSWSLDSSRRRCTVTSPRKPRGRPNSCGKLWKIVSSFKRMAYILEYCFFLPSYFVTSAQKRDPSSLLMHVTVWMQLGVSIVSLELPLKIQTCCSCQELKFEIYISTNPKLS